MLDRFAKTFFLLAICGIFFAYGFVANWKKIFPYQVIENAYLAFNALRELDAEDTGLPPGVGFWDDDNPSERPLIRRRSATAGDELIFGLGSDRTYRELNDGQGYGAWIADRDGNILHAWKTFEGTWNSLENREGIAEDWSYYPVGAHVYPDGGLLVSFQGSSVFPFAMGMARFDRDSNLLWKNSDFIHHWFDIGPDGSIYAVSLISAGTELKIPDRRKTLFCEKGEFHYDSIVVLNPDGVKIREIDMLDVLIESDLIGLIRTDFDDQVRLETCDPTHMNDVRVLGAETAAEYPGFSPGDLLLSFRALNTIMIVDAQTERIKWSQSGMMHHQHSPRFRGDGEILVFDNLGGLESRGTSRIIGIDVSTRRTRTVFPADGAALPEQAFFSQTAGHIDISEDGRRALVAWTHAGLISEIDIATGAVLWEWLNTHRVEGRTGRLNVPTAKYAGNLDFPMNGGVLGN